MYKKCKAGIIIFTFIVLACQFLVRGYAAFAEEIPSSENVTDMEYEDDVRGVLNDWDYTETEDAIILTRYIGPAADIIIPGIIDGKQVFLQNSGTDTGLECFPENTTSIVVGSAGEKVRIVDGNASRLFSGLTKLTYLDVKGLDTGSITNMDYMFQNCNSLSELDMSGWNTSNVTSMYSMFRGCRSLRSLNLSSWDMGHVTNIACMFYSCTSLAELNLSGWNTSNITDGNMEALFYDCSGLMSLDVSGWDTSNVTLMQNIFFNCSSLTRLNLSSWDTSNVVSMNYMFHYCTSLEELNVSGWDTGNVQGMLYMFYNCRKLQLLDLSGHDYSSVMPGLTAGVFDLEDASAELPTLIISNDPLIQSICDGPVAGRVPAGPTYHFGEGTFRDEEGNSAAEMKYFDTLLIPDINDFTVHSIANKYIPDKEGAIFAGWYLDEAYSQPFETAGDTMSTVDLINADLYAKYTNRYTVTFIDYDGSIIKEMIVLEGGAAIAPEEDPVREGYTFTGWDKDFENITEDLVVKALYEEKKGTQESTDQENGNQESESQENGDQENESQEDGETDMPDEIESPAETGTTENTPETGDTAPVKFFVILLFSSFIALVIIKSKYSK